MPDTSELNDDLFSYRHESKDSVTLRLEVMERQIKGIQMTAHFTLFLVVVLAGGVIGYVLTLRTPQPSNQNEEITPVARSMTNGMENHSPFPYQNALVVGTIKPRVSPVVVAAANPGVRLIDYLLERERYFLVFKGRAENLTGRDQMICLKITFEDKNGKFVEVHQTYLQPTPLAAGEIGTFRTMITPDLRFHRYIVQYDTEILADGIINPREYAR